MFSGSQFSKYVITPWRPLAALTRRPPHVLIGCWALDIERSAFASLSATSQFSTRPRQIFDPLPLVRTELEFRRSHVLLEMRERRCARDRQHDRRFLQQPGERELHDADIETSRFGFQCIAGLAQRTAPTATDRRPRNESHFFFLAVVQRGLRLAGGHVVSVLSAHNRPDLF